MSLCWGFDKNRLRWQKLKKTRAQQEQKDKKMIYCIYKLHNVFFSLKCLKAPSTTLKSVLNCTFTFTFIILNSSCDNTVRTKNSFHHEMSQCFHHFLLHTGNDTANLLKPHHTGACDKLHTCNLVQHGRGAIAILGLGLAAAH